MSKISTIFTNLGLAETRSFDSVYIISMTARVGSTAFVDALRYCGICDYPIREIFNPRSSLKHLTEELQPSSLVDYLNLYCGASEQDSLVFKTNWIDFREVVALVGDSFTEIFPNTKFVHIERKDKVAQAYSLWKANEYNIWHVEKDQKYESPTVGKIPLDKIEQNLKALVAEEQGWQKYFEQQNISPHTIFFEDFAQDLHDSVSEAFLYFTGQPTKVTPTSWLKRSFDEKDASVLLELNTKLASRKIGW